MHNRLTIAAALGGLAFGLFAALPVTAETVYPEDALAAALDGGKPTRAEARAAYAIRHEADRQALLDARDADYHVDPADPWAPVRVPASIGSALGAAMAEPFCTSIKASAEAIMRARQAGFPMGFALAGVAEGAGPDTPVAYIGVDIVRAAYRRPALGGDFGRQEVDRFAIEWEATCYEEVLP